MEVGIALCSAETDAHLLRILRSVSPEAGSVLSVPSVALLHRIVAGSAKEAFKCSSVHDLNTSPTPAVESMRCPVWGVEQLLAKACPCSP